MSPTLLRTVLTLAVAACGARLSRYAGAPQPPVAFSCTVLNTTQLAPNATWTSLNCSSLPPHIPDWGAFGPLVVNVVTARVDAASNLRLVPVAAPPSTTLAPLNALAAADGRQLLAGINGGYFWRVDVSTFVDSVCQGKTFADANLQPAWSTPNSGVGDGATVAAGVALSSNCNKPGFSRPAVLTLNGTSSNVAVLHRGALPPAGLTLDSISAGPNLVTSNSSGSFIDIPADDDNLGNILEHAGEPRPL